MFISQIRCLSVCNVSDTVLRSWVLSVNQKNDSCSHGVYILAQRVKTNKHNNQVNYLVCQKITLSVEEKKMIRIGGTDC